MAGFHDFHHFIKTANFTNAFEGDPGRFLTPPPPPKKTPGESFKGTTFQILDIYFPKLACPSPSGLTKNDEDLKFCTHILKKLQDHLDFEHIFSIALFQI